MDKAKSESPILGLWVLFFFKKKKKRKEKKRKEKAMEKWSP